MDKSKVAQVIEQGSKLVFKPSLDFYQSTNINRKRWGLIYAGKLEPTVSEIARIAHYFGIPVTNFFNEKSPTTTV